MESNKIVGLTFSTYVILNRYNYKLYFLAVCYLSRDGISIGKLNMPILINFIIMVFRTHLRELRERFKERKSVHEIIRSIASKNGLDPLSHEFAQYLDDNDELKHLREEFSFPKVSECVPKGVGKHAVSRLL